MLEVTFCASGNSLEDAAEDASQIFIGVAVASGLEPADLVGFEVEANLAAPLPSAGRHPPKVESFSVAKGESMALSLLRRLKCPPED